MNTKTFVLLGLVVASLSPAAKADLDIGVSAEIRLGRALPPAPPEVVIVEEVGPGGPPPWAKTRWYRRNHAYYYYPGGDVYYRPADRQWFYLEGSNWRFGTRLPDHIRLDFGRSVFLNLESDRPYVYHNDVVRYYPGHYFTKVKIKSAPNHASDRAEDRRDHARDRDDRGNGKGRNKEKKRN